LGTVAEGYKVVKATDAGAARGAGGVLPRRWREI